MRSTRSLRPRRSLLRSLAIAVMLVGAGAFSGSGAVEGAKLAAEDLPGTCQVMMFGDRVYCLAMPGVDVRVELRSASGELMAEGLARSSATNGTVLVQLSSPTGAEVVIRPGSTLGVLPDGGQPFTVPVPRLLAEVEATGDRLLGSGLPQVELAAARGSPYGANVPIATTTADALGNWSLSVPGTKLGPGDYGFVRQADAAGNTFLAMYGAFTTEITVGERAVLGIASAGLVVTAQIRSHDGSALKSAEARYESGRSLATWKVLSPRIHAGTVLTVTRESPVTGGRDMDVVLVPDLSVIVQTDRQRISGMGPPATELLLEAGPYRDIERGRAPVATSVRTTETGAYALDVDAIGGLEAGWSVRATLRLRPHVNVRALFVLRTIRVAAYGTQVSGVVEPRQPVTVTLQDALTGKQEQATSMSGPDGAFAVRFIGYALGAEVTILPRDVLDIDVGRLGDPIVFPVPQVSARTDVSQGLVGGTGPAGWQVTGTIEEPARSALRPTVVGADGAYALQGTLAAGMAGLVSFRDASGREVVTQWAALQMQIAITAGQTRVSGNGPAGRQLVATLESPSGQSVGRCESRLRAEGTYGFAGSWGCGFLDSAGSPISPLPEDRVAATVGDDDGAVEIPMVVVLIDPGEDRVEGRLPPDTVADLAVERARTGLEPEFSQRVQVRSDGLGAFAFDFGGSFDIRANDVIHLDFSTPNGTQVQYSRVAPGIQLDLSRAEVSGAVPAPGDVTVELRSEGVTRFADTVPADPLGSFHLVLSERGTVVYPHQGDELFVRSATSGGPDVRLVVPELSVAADRVDRVVRGGSSVAGDLFIRARPPAFAIRDATGLNGFARASLDRDGTFELAAATFQYAPGAPGGLTFRRGLQIEALLALPDGNQVIRRTTIPMLNVTHGGADVCGFADPGQEVVIAVDRGSRGRLQGQGQVARDGRFRVTLRDSDGRPVATEPNQQVWARIDADEMALTVPAITARADWVASPAPGRGLATTRLSGAGPSRTDYYITSPAAGVDPCFAGAGPYLFTTSGITDRDGRFNTLVDAVPPGQAVEAAFYDGEGNRTFARAQRLLGRVYIDTNQVSGIGQPFALGDVQLLDANGTLRARQELQSDASGAFTVRLSDDDQRAVLIRATDSVRIRLGDETATIPVEMLSFDFSPRLGIMGRAPAQRSVRLQLDLVDGAVLEFNRDADVNGLFMYQAADLPPRRSWDLTEVMAITATLVTLGGHEIVLEASTGIEPPVAPRLFLPFALRPRQ